jgi:hypothetical protein
MVNMEKYTAIVKRSKDTYEKNLENALCEIYKMQEDGELIKVSTLMKRTGLSRAYFYNNKEVQKKIQDARREQGIKSVNENCQSQMIKALKQANKILVRELRNKSDEIELLKEEVKKLKLQINKYLT